MVIIPSLALSDPAGIAVSARARSRDLINEWAWAGFSWVQLVDGGGRERRRTGRGPMESLIPDVRIRVQAAGDISSVDEIDALSQAGASRVVLGQRAVDEPDWLEAAATAFPGLLVVESTVRERRVRSRGWVRTLPVDIRDLADELSMLPLGGLLVAFAPDTAISVDDLSLAEDLVETVPFPVLAGGGAQSLTSLRDLEFRGVSAAIVDLSAVGQSIDELTLARAFVD